MSCNPQGTAHLVWPPNPVDKYSSRTLDKVASASSGNCSQPVAGFLDLGGWRYIAPFLLVPRPYCPNPTRVPGGSSVIRTPCSWSVVVRIGDAAPNRCSLDKPKLLSSGLCQALADWLSGDRKDFRTGPDLNVARRHKLPKPDPLKEASIPPYPGDIGALACQRATRPYNTPSRSVR